MYLSFEGVCGLLLQNSKIVEDSEEATEGCSSLGEGVPDNFDDRNVFESGVVLFELFTDFCEGFPGLTFPEMQILRVDFPFDFKLSD
jgi:hypothetical protein